MIKKTALAIRGISGKGKSATIKLIREELKRRYSHTESLLIDDGDIKSIITISELKIGIESQGDPNSRQGKSLDDFVSRGCHIIICACRTNGETQQNVINLKSKEYRLIWATNYRSYQIPHSDLNKVSVNHLCELINEIISGTL